MLRGNHESAAMTSAFTFKWELTEKANFGQDIYEKFLECFCAMPVAADVNGDYLCMHGGVSPELMNKSDIDKVERRKEPDL